MLSIHKWFSFVFYIVFGLQGTKITAATVHDILAPTSATHPKHIALLLPLTGTLSGPAHAIKDGFMAGVQASGRGNAVSLRLYDTNTDSVQVLYQKAVTDGADYIVGPLSKANVMTVAAMVHPVPTLLLNDAHVSFKNDNAYQFGLSPRYEAKQVAHRAQQEGHTHVLVLAPFGHWGSEPVLAFTKEWRNGGGVVVDTLYYQDNDDMNVRLRDFLGVSDSERRGKQLKQWFGAGTEVIPSRRQDFNAIFLLAYPSKARQIVPLLRYYFADDVALYATSVSYAGAPDVMKDKDLNGLIFCDMPWVFSHQMANKNWPESFNSYNRLYALGWDSYTLSSQWNQLQQSSDSGIHYKKDVFYVTPSQHVVREMAWGKIQYGRVQRLS